MKNLGPRIVRLEQAVGEIELPNGGIVMFEVNGGETEAQAWQRTLRAPWIVALNPSQRMRLIPVRVWAGDLGVL